MSVCSALSRSRFRPAIKRVYSDPFAQPVVLKGIFAEMGKTPDRDQILIALL